jgi:hypothetical protein
MGQPNVFTRILAASNATAVAASQSPGTGTITLNGGLVSGGVATLDSQRRVVLVSGGNDSAITFTLFGTNDAGFPISETLAGGNTTAVSTLDYKTITNIVHSGTVTSTLVVGTGNTGSSLWQITNWNADPFQIGYYIESRAGTATFALEYTMDDPNILPGTGGLNASGNTTSLAITLTTAIGSALATSPFIAWRLTTQSGTGSLVVRALQAGLGSP